MDTKLVEKLPMKKAQLKEAIKHVLRHKLTEITSGGYKHTSKKQQYGILTGKKDDEGDPIVQIVGYGTMALNRLKKETLNALDSVRDEARKGNYKNVEYLLEPHSIVMLFIKALREVKDVLPINESTEYQPGQTYNVDHAVAAIVLSVENELITVVSCDSSQQEINKNVWNLVTKKAKALGLSGSAFNEAVKESMKRLGYVSDSPNLEELDASSMSSVGDAISNALTANSQTNPIDQKRIAGLEKQKTELQKDLEVDKARLASVVSPLQKKIDQKTEKLGKLTTDIERSQKVASR